MKSCVVECQSVSWLPAQQACEWVWTSKTKYRENSDQVVKKGERLLFFVLKLKEPGFQAGSK